MRLAAADAGGAVQLSLAGARACCRASGALWLPAERALVAADLHLEKGSAYAARGQLLPPYDTAATLGRLEAEVAALDPSMIVLLGDSFHDGRAGERLGAEAAARIAALAAERRLVWVLGNHDADFPAGLPGERVAGLALAGLALTHEPLAGRRPGEVAGHLHPCVRVRAAAASVRARSFVTDGERIILPAFGAYAGGLNLLDRAFAGLFAHPPSAVVLGRARAHLVPWRALRPD